MKLYFLLIIISFVNPLCGQNKNNLNLQEVLSPIRHYNPIESQNKSSSKLEFRNKKYISVDSVIFSGKDEPRTLIKYSFDTLNNSDHAFYFSYSENVFNPLSYFQFDFDKENILHNITYCKPWDGNYDVPGNNEVNWIRRATYNEDSKVKLYSYFLPHEGEEFLINEYDHYYDDNGNLSELHYHSYLSGNWALTNIWFYRYNKNLLSEAIKKIKDENGSWVTTDSTTYEYYSDSKLKTSSRQTDMNIQNGSIRVFTFLYEYNEIGQLTGRHRYNSVERDGDISVDIDKSYNYYDNLGNLILTESFDSSETYGLIILDEEHFTYNLEYTSQQTQLPKPNAFYFNEDILNRSPLYPIKTYERYVFDDIWQNPILFESEEYFYSEIETSSTSDSHVSHIKVSV